MEKPSDYQSKNPVQKRSQRTRQKILNAAMAQIAEVGFEKTNTNLIADMAEVSIGTIYVHFKDKSEIFLTILDEFLQNVYDNLSRGIDEIQKKGLEMAEIVEWLIRVLYQEHQLNGGLNLEIAKFVLKDQRAADLRAFWNQKMDSAVIRLVEPYMDQILIRDIDTGIVVANRSTHQVFQYLYKNKGRVNENAILEEFTDMIKRYLGA